MKTSEVREMSVADLRDRIQVEKNRLDTMRLNHAISPLEDTSEFKKVRKDIARMLTILAEKENEKRRLSEERAKRAQEVQKAFDELCDARKNYQDVLSRFCNDYGSYHFSVGSHNSASDAADLILKTIFSVV